MSRPRVLFLLALGLLLTAPPIFAANYAVGTCKPSLPSYTTISAAVGAVPPGSTVEVCPGTYAEQITISQPLTLKGITSGNTSDVIIAVPGSGLTTIPDCCGLQFAAQVAVTAGPVNISNITVDGTGNNINAGNCFSLFLVGIFFENGSSGTLNESTLRQLITSGCPSGVGVWADNVSPAYVAVENSSFHDIDYASVVMGWFGGPAIVKGNSMAARFYQVLWYGGGTLSGNVLNGGLAGVYDEGPFTISGNTITNSTFGLSMFYAFGGGLTVTANKISNVSTGIVVSEGGDTYKSNAITNAGTAIEFNCNAPTVASNSINDATTGFDQVPAGFSGVNSFNNVVTIRTDGCGSRASKAVPGSPSAPRLPIPTPAR